jgi:hypothetical protein
MRVHDRRGRQAGRWIDGASLLERELSPSRILPAAASSQPPLEPVDDRAA